MIEQLRVENLSKSFDGLTILKDISFTVTSDDRRVVIIGPNGAGKTTLFNVIGGQLAATNGHIYVFGNNVTRLPAHRRTHLGIARTFQITNLFPQFTVIENLLVALQVHAPSRYQMFRPLSSYRHFYEKADALLEKMKLRAKKNHLVTSLSHGEARLVEILMGVASDPKILLLDEPTAGLTCTEAVWLSDLMLELLEGVTLIIIEHDMNVAFNLAKRMLVLHQGTIAVDGKPDDIKGNQVVREIYLGSCNG
jgi:branched-chain amino acid transport system ATP-binding protein